MHIEIEREIHELTLTVVTHGRRLAEEWRQSSCVPKGVTKRIILEALDQLSQCEGFEAINAEFFDLTGNEIRRSLNARRDGFGDRALSDEIDTSWEEDKGIIRLVNLAWRWKEFKFAKRTLDDKLAAVRWVDKMLESIV